MNNTRAAQPHLRLSRVLALWWPLAASWALMGVELPLFTAVVARMPEPETNLAAYGSLVFPIALVIEGPIIMLLAASTALCKDWPAYRKVHRFMTSAGLALTLVHVLAAFTPLYYVIARHLIGVPEEVVEPGRIGLMIMTPWTWAIAHRRFHQGVLIRFERSRSVSAGTLVRLAANALVLATGYVVGDMSGIVLGTLGIATGVVAEAAYVRWRVEPVLREHLRPIRVEQEPLTRAAFLRFYTPLALTPLLTLLNQPLGASAMSRMPESLASLAAWPAVHGLVFLLRSAGFAYNEVVVALLDRPGAVRALRRFAVILGGCTVGLLVCLAATPLGAFWFGTVLRLTPDLAALSHTAICLAVLMPGYQAFQSWYQGALVHGRFSRPVTEAVVIYLIVSGICLTTGVALQAWTAIFWTILSFTTAGVVQTLWLRLRCRAVLAVWRGQRGDQ